MSISVALYACTPIPTFLPLTGGKEAMKLISTASTLCSVANMFNHMWQHLCL